MKILDTIDQLEAEIQELQKMIFDPEVDKDTLQRTIEEIGSVIDKLKEI